MSKSLKNCIGMKCIVLANSRQPKRDHLYIVGEITSVELSTMKLRVKHKAPWGTTSGWFQTNHVFLPLDTVEVQESK